MKGRPELLCKMHRVRAPGKMGEEPFEDERVTEQVPAVPTGTSSGGPIPALVFAGASPPGRVVSPSLASNTSTSNTSSVIGGGTTPPQNLQGLLDSNSPTSLLLLLRQQQEQLLQQQQLLNHEKQAQFKNQSQQQLAESLIIQHMLAQQQRQEQQRQLNDLLAGALAQNSVITHSHNKNAVDQQGALVQAFLGHLLVQPQEGRSSNGVNDVNVALLAGLLR
jgi:hypothetical protein